MSLCGIALGVTPRTKALGGEKEFQIQYRDTTAIWPAKSKWIPFKTFDMESEMLEMFPRLRREVDAKIKLRMVRIEHLSDYAAYENALTDGAAGGILKSEPATFAEPVTEDDWGDS